MVYTGNSGGIRDLGKYYKMIKTNLPKLIIQEDVLWYSTLTEETPWTCSVRTYLLVLGTPSSVCLWLLQILNEGDEGLDIEI